MGGGHLFFQAKFAFLEIAQHGCVRIGSPFFFGDSGIEPCMFGLKRSDMRVFHWQYSFGGEKFPHWQIPNKAGFYALPLTLNL